MSFSPAGLLPFAARLTGASRLLIAYSGGMDSHVLLHALAQLRAHFPGVELQAIHINHSLHASAADWAQHCARACAALEVPCEIRVVDARALSGVSPEDAARAARYGVFAEVVQAGDVLFTAHHQDDQAETLLLQLLRGAGPQGLAGMSDLSRFGTAWLARPLLEFSRAELLGYALAQQLHWIDDPSNVDTRFDRNYLRHEILPHLQRRWPAAQVTLARSAQHCAEAAELLEVLARSDFQDIQLDKSGNATTALLLPSGRGKAGMGVGHINDPHPALPPSRGKELFADPLSVSKLLQLSPARQRNVLRFWIEQADLPAPQQRHLHQLQNEVLTAAADAEPRAHWPGVDILRYRDALYAMPQQPVFDASQQYEWRLDMPLKIANVGTLTACHNQQVGLRADACAAGVRVAFRSGGERIKPAGRAHHATLKNLFQQVGVPPWLRERVPLLYIGAELAAVAGYWYADEFAARVGAITIEFQPE